MTQHLVWVFTDHQTERQIEWPFLNQQKEENSRRNYFMINLQESMGLGRYPIHHPWNFCQTHYLLRYNVQYLVSYHQTNQQEIKEEKIVILLS